MSKRGVSGGAAFIAAILLLLVVWTTLSFAFRGPVVEIPNAFVGRIKTASGFEPGLLKPKIFRLPSNWFGWNPSKLIIAETSRNRVEEDIPGLYMPHDKLKLDVQVVGNFTISTDEGKVEAIYDRLTPEPVSGQPFVAQIGFAQLYSKYGRQILRSTTQEIVAGYSIQYVLENLDPISVEIHDKVNQRLANSPISALYCGLGKIQPPDLIVKAQEQAKKREIEIATANNQKQVALTKADAAYQVGLKQQQIELVEAETQVLSDLVISDAVSPGYIAQRSLRVLSGLAANPNVSFVLATRMFEDPGSLLGLSHTTLAQLKATTTDREAKLRDTLEKIENAKREAAEQLKQEAQNAAAPAVEQNK